MDRVVLHEKKEHKKAPSPRALHVGRVSLDAVHDAPDIAITWNEMGNMCYETGDLESALLKAYEHQGITVKLAAASLLEPDNPNIYASCSNEEI
jgi:hypothetical protein